MNPLRESYAGMLRVIVGAAAMIALPTWLLATALSYEPPAQLVIVDAMGQEIAVPILPSLLAALVRGLLITLAATPIPLVLLGIATLVSKVSFSRRRYLQPDDAVVLHGVSVTSRTETSWDPRTDDEPVTRARRGPTSSSTARSSTASSPTASSPAGALSIPPDIAALVSAVISEIGASPGAVLAAGASALVLQLIAVFGAGIVLVIFVLTGQIFGDAFGLAAEGEIAGFALGGTISALLLLVSAAGIQASLTRAAAEHLDRREPLGFGSPLATFSQDLPQTIGIVLLVSAAVMVGYALFIVPGLWALCALLLALPVLALRGGSVGDAVNVSMASMRERPGFHVGLLFALFVIGLVGTVPLIGSMFVLVAQPMLLAAAARSIDRA